MNDTANPYAAPEHGAEIQPVQAGQGWVYLSFWQRVVASIADNIILGILGFILGLGLVYVMNNEKQAEMVSNIAGWILGVVFVLSFWIARNATPGKMIYAAEIRDAVTYGKPTTGQFIKRYLGYIPATLCLGVGLLWVAFDKRKRGWHDMIAGTVVVKRGTGATRPATRPVRRAPPPVRPGARPTEDLPAAVADR